MPAEHDPDAALMLRVKQGDMTAFAELVDKYKQPVMNLVYRTVRDATEALQNFDARATIGRLRGTESVLNAQAEACSRAFCARSASLAG